MSYRVHVWWDRPGDPEPGEEDLGQGWARLHERVTLPCASAVATYLKGHPEAEGVNVEEIDEDEQVINRHVGERTILGWLVSPENEAGT